MRHCFLTLFIALLASQSLSAAWVPTLAALIPGNIESTTVVPLRGDRWSLARAQLGDLKLDFQLHLAFRELASSVPMGPDLDLPGLGSCKGLSYSGGSVDAVYPWCDGRALVLSFTGTRDEWLVRARLALLATHSFFLPITRTRLPSLYRISLSGTMALALPADSTPLGARGYRVASGTGKGTTLIRVYDEEDPRAGNANAWRPRTRALDELIQQIGGLAASGSTLKIAGLEATLRRYQWSEDQPSRSTLLVTVPSGTRFLTLLLDSNDEAHLQSVLSHIQSHSSALALPRVVLGVRVGSAREAGQLKAVLSASQLVLTCYEGNGLPLTWPDPWIQVRAKLRDEQKSASGSLLTQTSRDSWRHRFATKPDSGAFEAILPDNRVVPVRVLDSFDFSEPAPSPSR